MPREIQKKKKENLNIRSWVLEQSKVDSLRFITCGSVDDGKSSLIGRLLWESNAVHADHLISLQSDSERYGTRGTEIDFSLLLDGLMAEIEQGITIDVAYRYFSTKKRRFVIADTPGHEQYTRNMISGASSSEAAIVLVNAQKGVLPQTRRHTLLLKKMGIQHIVLAVNKIDLVDYEQAVFESITKEFKSLIEDTPLMSWVSIPVSATEGDNVTSLSKNTPWYDGPPLLEHLERIDLRKSTDEITIFPIQLVSRVSANARGLCGNLIAGRLEVGDQVQVEPSGRIAKAQKILTGDGEVAAAHGGEAITLFLDEDLDISRGDVIHKPAEKLDRSDHFQATICWMSEEFGNLGRPYELKLLHQNATATISKFKHRVDIKTSQPITCNEIRMNDIAVVNLALNSPIVCSPFSSSRELGRFILVDKLNKSTLAAGMIEHTLRRSQNIRLQSLSIGRVEREKQNHQKGKVIWFTGLPGSGKSTIANALEKELFSRGRRTYLLDGDNLRLGLNRDLGFTTSDRAENIRRASEVAKIMLDAGLIVLAAFVSPYKWDRELARGIIGRENFFEVFVDTPLEVCQHRDPKGLYRKALRGEIPNMTGINSPYERPENPNFLVRYKTNNVVETVEKIIYSAFQRR